MNVDLSVAISEDAVEAIAARAAALVLEHLGSERGISQGSPYLTVHEAAAYLRCKPQRVYDLRSSGRLAGVKDGSRVLILRDDLDALLRGPVSRAQTGDTPVTPL